MKSERGKLLKYGCILALLFGITTFIVSLAEYDAYKKSVNHYLYGLMATIKEKYPEVTEKEMITLLNGKEKVNFPKEMLKYGIQEDTAILYSLEKNYHLSLILNLTIMVSFVLFFGFCFFWYYARKEKQIKEITTYMQEINRRNYRLSIEDNQEGELSILRNEVYKTTIMLREESERLKKEKLSLKDSISDISHQLKTPLTSILIMLDNILDNPNMDNKTKMEFIQNVRHQVENMNFLFISLLKLSRLETGIVVFKKENIDLEKIVENAIQNVEILKEVKNIKMQVEVKNKTIFTGDYHWELEAITNLLKNAIEHSYEEGKVDIEIEENSLYSKLTIQDYGCGMNKKDLQNIFKRFYKGENSSSDSIGIGLSLAKNIIEQDGGFIKVDSKVGKGTVFEIRYMK